MIVFVNGRFVPEAEATVSVFDRGFLYGDGLFETLRVANGKPFRWEQHLLRLRRGAELLKIKMPYSPEELRRFVARLVEENQMPEALLRLTLTRGIGIRGYSPQRAVHPTFTMSLHPTQQPDPERPVQWRLITSSIRLPAGEPLAHFKTCNKLPQILARAEADATGADEALLLNTDGDIVEASSANLFWLTERGLHTPPLAAGVLPGVTREVLFEIARELGLAAREMSISNAKLREAEGVFLSLSSLGVVEAGSLNGRDLKRSAQVPRLSTAYWDIVRAETGQRMTKP